MLGPVPPAVYVEIDIAADLPRVWELTQEPSLHQRWDLRFSEITYRDVFGRETVTWLRCFHLPARTRKFDATMIYSEKRHRIVDYLGSHQHLAIDIELGVDEHGGLRLRSGEQRFYERRVGFRFPMALSGYADVREWWSEEEERYRIESR